jgi:protein-tyrosine-phosphatase
VPVVDVGRRCIEDHPQPQLLTRDLAQQSDFVITMGCGDQCPYIPGKRYLDWDLPNPKDRPIDEVRATRDEIARRDAALWLHSTSAEASR